MIIQVSSVIVLLFLFGAFLLYIYTLHKEYRTTKRQLNQSEKLRKEHKERYGKANG